MAVPESKLATHDVREALAPWWHTVVVLAVLAIGSLASAHQHGLPNFNLPGMGFRLSGYLTVLAEEWLLTLFLLFPLRKSGTAIRSVIGERWATVGAFFRDLGLAAGLVVLTVLLLSVLPQLLGMKADSSAANLTPKTALELAVWLVLAVTAGFCEELLFRGYLIRQFAAWTGNRAIGIALQGVCFGLAHGFYGKIMLLIMVHGWLLGAFAWWRKSLRPGMLAHGLQDALGGIAAFMSHV